MAEWMQAQWKQNLGITISLRNMESKTFLAVRTKLDYKGFSRGGWSADYMDPFTYLSLFAAGGDSGTWSVSGSSMNINGDLSTIESFDCKTLVLVNSDVNVPGDKLKITLTRQ